MEIVYVLSNPAFDRHLKIGGTTDLEQRLRQLDNTSVPLPFRCEFAIEVDNEAAVESLVHQAFADVRVRSNREFFAIDAQRAIAALKLAGGRAATPKADVAEDKESIEALERTVAKKKRPSFGDAHVHVGGIFIYTKDDMVTAKVIDDRHH